MHGSYNIGISQCTVLIRYVYHNARFTQRKVFEVFAAAAMNIQVARDITPCQPRHLPKLQTRVT
jgi:hypothetical protein